MNRHDPTRVGMDIKISIQEVTVIESTAFKGEHDLVLMARNPLFLYDPQGAFESDYASSGSYNISRYNRLDEKIKAVATIGDTGARYEQCRQMERQIVEEDVATIALSSYLQIDAVRKGVTGYQPHPVDHIALTERIEKA